MSLQYREGRAQRTGRVARLKLTCKYIEITLSHVFRKLVTTLYSLSKGGRAVLQHSRIYSYPTHPDRDVWTGAY